MYKRHSETYYTQTIDLKKHARNDNFLHFKFTIIFLLRKTEIPIQCLYVLCCLQTAVRRRFADVAIWPRSLR